MPKKILLINLGGIGDILLSSPALRALRSAYPQARISMLTVPRSRSLVKNYQYLDDVFIFHLGYNRGFIFDFFKDLKTLLILRKKRFDLAINMRPLVSKKSAGKIKFLLKAIAPKIKLGQDTEGRGGFFDMKIEETDIGQKHEIEYNIDTVKLLGIDVKDKSISLAIGEEELKKINEILNKEGVSPGDILIGLHPGGMPSRRWPLINFAEAINEIHKKLPSSKFIISAGREEIGLAAKLAKMSKGQAINLAGKLDFNQLSALIKRCHIFICNDTGPMHIAAILKTPLVAIFGPGDLTRYDPRAISDKAMVLYQKTDCAPCDNFACRDLRCLKLISPQEVVLAALTLIGQNRK